jgi:hypothetical protein
LQLGDINRYLFYFRGDDFAPAFLLPFVGFAGDFRGDLAAFFLTGDAGIRVS